jgi:hypothetical protein
MLDKVPSKQAYLQYFERREKKFLGLTTVLKAFLK